MTQAISVVIPTLNEVGNVPVLASRIAQAFAGSGLQYELIFVDDRSKDGTQQAIEQLTDQHLVSFVTKVGPRGKAYSLLQGFDIAKHDIICMIDADLQYPPEAIIPMYHLLTTNNVDVVLTEREDHETGVLRRLSSKVFNFAFTRLLFGFDYDSQSGLKLFKKNVIKHANLSPTPWSFDLEFIVRALENNFKILSHKIQFSDRFSGQAKVRVLKVAYELAKASIKLRYNSSPSKVKQAYRTNLQIAARVTAFALIPLLGFFASAAVLLTPAKASALPLLDLAAQRVSDQLAPIQNFISPTSNNTLLAPANTTTEPEESNNMDLSTTVPRSDDDANSSQTNPQVAILANSSRPTETPPLQVRGANAPLYHSSVATGSFAYPNARPERFKTALKPLAILLTGSLAVASVLVVVNRYTATSPDSTNA